MTSKTLQLSDRLHAYLLANSLRETPVQRRLRAATRRLPRASMQIGPEQGMFMQLLVKLMRAETHRRSRHIHRLQLARHGARAAARRAHRLLRRERSLDRNRAQALEIGRRGEEDQFAHRARARNARCAARARGDAGRYDFAFIDADKSNYANYYERCLKLVRRGGLIAVDNTLWGGSVADLRVRDADTRAIRAFNRKLHRDRRIDLALLPIGDGLTLALKR